MCGVWKLCKYFLQFSSFYYFDYRQIGRAKGHVKKSELTEPATPRPCRALRLSRTSVMYAREPELVPNSQLSFPVKTKLSSSSDFCKRKIRDGF
jgi:hypothetical protein